MTNWDQQYCPTCGAGQVPDAYFCGNCGTSFQPAEPAYPQPAPAPAAPYQPHPSDAPPYQPAEAAYPYEDAYLYEDAQTGDPTAYPDPSYPDPAYPDPGYPDHGYPDPAYPADLRADDDRSGPWLPEPFPEAEVDAEDPQGSDESRPVRTQRGPAPLLAFAGILIVAVTAASPTLLAADDNDNDGDDQATPAAAVNPAELAEDEVLLQATDQVPVGAFFPEAELDAAQADDAETDLADIVVRVVSLPDHPTTRDETNASLSELTVTGTDDGVYSGQRRAGVCDRDALAALVAGDGSDEDGEGDDEAEGSAEDDEGSTEDDEPSPAASVAEEYAAALDLDSPEDLGGYIDDLTAVRLRLDTRVTQHNLVDGTVVPTQTILQAGTGVLVDETGLARVSCNGGNPLSSPAQPGDTEAALEVDQVAVNHAEAWERLDPSRVVTVEPGTEPLEQVLFADVDSTDLVERPLGTNGGRDMGPGDFEATLEWDAPADLDIAVVDPNEATISSQLPEPPNSTGRLAEDANSQCQDNMVGKEEIAWPEGDAPEGEYVVQVTGHAVGEGPSDNQDVDYEHDCGGENAEFKLTVRLYGQDTVVHEESVTDGETKDYTVTVGDPPGEGADSEGDSAEPEDA